MSVLSQAAWARLLNQNISSAMAVGSGEHQRRRRVRSSSIVIAVWSGVQRALHVCEVMAALISATCGR